MAVNWTAPKPITQTEAIVTQCALRELNEFELTSNNFERFIEMIRQQRILVVYDANDTPVNVGDISEAELMDVTEEFQQLIGFSWTW